MHWTTIFDKHIHSYNHHHYQDTEQSHYLPKSLMPFGSQPHPSPPALGNTDQFSVSIILHFPQIHINGTTQSVSF